MTRPHRLFILLGAFAGMVCIPFARAADSVIQDVQGAAKSVVSIKSDAGGLYKDRPAAFIDKESGRLVILENIKALQYSRSGGGVIIDPSGIIVTNAHIVTQAGRILVTLSDGMSLPATVVHTLPDYDLALLQVQPPAPLPAMEFSHHEPVEFGTRVYSIGSSDILKNTISEGTVSAMGISKETSEAGRTLVNLIEINFNAYKGDSGSPVLDGEGRLLGIAAAGSQLAQTTYAIPSYFIKKIYFEYLAQKK